MASKGEDPEELRLLLVGCTGAGKSATGNSILLQKEENFEEFSDPILGSSRITMASGDPLKTGRRIIVTDTPDVSDTWLNSFTDDGKYFMDMVRPGPHAIILVMAYASRFDKEIKAKIMLLHKILGEECTRHMILVFTYVDMVKGARQLSTPQTFEKYLSGLKKDDFANSLLKDCNERFVKFDNRIDHNESEDKMNEGKKQVQTLLTMVEKMVNENVEKYDQKYYPIENVKKGEDPVHVRVMKRFALAAYRPSIFMSTYAAGICFYKITKCLGDSLSIGLVAPVGCLLPVVAWQLYKRDKKRVKLSVLNYDKGKINRTTLFGGFSSGFLFAYVLVLALDTLNERSG